MIIRLVVHNSSLHVDCMRIVPLCKVFDVIHHHTVDLCKHYMTQKQFCPYLNCAPHESCWLSNIYTYNWKSIECKIRCKIKDWLCDHVLENTYGLLSVKWLVTLSFQHMHGFCELEVNTRGRSVEPIMQRQTRRRAIHGSV